MKKQILLLIIVLATVAVVSGCRLKADPPRADNKKPNNIVNQPENNTGAENQNNPGEQVATSTIEDVNQNLEKKKEYQGEVINEADGWKRYVNNYYGIEFRFRDEESLLFSDKTKDNIQFGKNCIEDANICAKKPQYIELNFRKYEKKQYQSLNNYINTNWKTFWETNPSTYALTKIFNNNVNIYKLATDLDINYYSESKYNEGNIEKTETDAYYIEIQCRNLNFICDDILKSLNTLNN